MTPSTETRLREAVKLLRAALQLIDLAPLSHGDDAEAFMQATAREALAATADLDQDPTP